LKDIIHHSLEGGQAISDIREHCQEFEKSMVHAKDSLLLITRLDPDIVEFSVNI